jgi:hypothetical protein
MESSQSRRARALHVALRIFFTGAMLCLFAVVWLVGRTPVAHAAGVPYCGKLADEHAPTRPAAHLNRSEGPEGTDLTVTANGWHPGAHVSLHFDARDPKTGELYTLIPDFAKGTVARNGAITLSSLNAPSFFCVDMYSSDETAYRFDQSGGAPAFFVLVSDHGEVSAPVAFRYLLAPTVAFGGLDSYGSATVGSMISVSGSGWEPHEPLTLTLVTAKATGFEPLPYTTQEHTTADARGAFAASYPLDARLRWDSNVMLAVEGRGPRFGTLDEYGTLVLAPAVQPTFHVDHTLVTPGMTFTVSGEHWYPGDSYTIKYCEAQLGNDGWTDGPNCGKEVNPAFGSVTADANGRMRQQFTIPTDEPPGVIMVGVTNLAPWVNMQQIAIHVVDHLPTWDDIHPRVAALRNRLVASLPFTIPATLLFGMLAFFAIRRWRMGQSRHV